MQVFLIIIHVIACLFLIAVILLQAGRGGGLSDIAGGAQTQSIFGTETNKFMKRLTEIFAVVFILTSLTLGIISTHQGKSLMEKRRLAENFKKSLPLSKSEVKDIQKSVEAAAKAPETAKVAETAVFPKADAPVAGEASLPVPSASVDPSKPAEGNAK